MPATRAATTATDVAVTAAKRVPALPGVPTVAESGWQGVEASTWFGLVVPARTLVAGIPARIVREAKLDVGGIEYLETPDGRRVFYDINANSNLRPSVAAAFGFDPFERVVDYLERELRTAGTQA